MPPPVKGIGLKPLPGVRSCERQRDFFGRFEGLVPEQRPQHETTDSSRLFLMENRSVQRVRS